MAKCPGLIHALPARQPLRMLEADIALFEKLALVDETLGTIQRTAAKIAALPREARDEAFIMADRAYAEAMVRCGQDTIAAAKWVESVMTAVRVLVAEIDSGGRNGGHA